MKIHTYGLMALVIFAISMPTLVLAETENEGSEIEKQSTVKETEYEGNDESTNSINSYLILFVTLVAIACVVGYSAWNVYKIRRRSAPKTLI